MRKIVFIFLLFVVVFANSCTHEYICQCVVTYTGVQPGLPDSSIHEFKIKDKRDAASKNCEANTTQTNQNGVVSDSRCKLF
jgi:hypothetical protein